MEASEARANARRAVLVMRRQLESSRESNISSRSVLGIAPSTNHNELRQDVDGPADQTSQHNQGIFKEVVSDIAHLAKPLYDPADSIEEATKYSAADAPRFWTRNALPSMKQIPVANAIMQPLKVLYDAPDSVETMAKTAMTSPAKYWQPKKTILPELSQTGKSVVTEGPVKIMYDAADASTEAVGFNSTSSPHYWSPGKLKRAEQPTKQRDADTSNAKMSAARDTIPSSDQRTKSLVQDRVTALQGQPATPVTLNRREDTRTEIEALEHDCETVSPVSVSPQSVGVVPNQQASESRTMSDWRTQPGPVSPVQIFIQQPQPQYPANLRSADYSSRRLDPSRSSTQYRRSRRPRRVLPVLEAQAGDITSGLSDDDTVVRKRHHTERLRSHKSDESLTSLQLATQSLDRALISLNGLLDEAMSMIDHATSSGKHGEVINIINATNDSFRTAKVAQSRRR
ncbi:hypothetical protein AMS68_002962 [Peltaster fructicola]|uniref:Uncharacterized protein n=1 Tax=Peltaster fructicola TaxID=286661 RepID=A0A6H0XS33_9PEZI|nr:hypothetical protein AMS68_002962 [Peltaster fructicola]